MWAQAGHRAVIILILPYMSSLKLRPRPQWVLRNLKPVTNASNKPATRLQSYHTFASPRPRNESSRTGYGIDCNAVSNRAPRDPKRHPRFSSVVWNQAAVHKPLKATRSAPTIRPALHALAVRQRPCKSEWTQRRLTNLRAQFERLQMAVAMSRMLPL